MSSVIYFRHNDMQDCVIKLGKWYRTAVAEARFKATLSSGRKESSGLVSGFGVFHLNTKSTLVNLMKINP